MIKKILLLLIVTMTFNPFFMSSATEISEQPIKVLLLHSYSQNLSWTADENEGFFDVLDESGHNFDVTIEYMDTKHNYSETFYEKFDSLFKYKHLKAGYDFIAVTDDNALRYILSIKNEHFNDTPLFFCGSNAQFDFDFDVYNDIYGIHERTSLKETMTLINELQPQLDTIYFLFDESNTAALTVNDLKAQITDNNLALNFKFLSAPTMEELLKKTNSIRNEKSAFIYGFYMTDASGLALDPSESARKLVESTPLPIYALWDFSMDTGAVGGKLISGHEQGARMGELLLSYLDESTTTSLLDASLSNTYMADYMALERFEFNSSHLPKDTIVINKPDTFFERHRYVIIGAMILTCLLFVYIVLLRIQIQRKSKIIEKATHHMMEYRRQASLSNLVKGVAHDINTPLGSIITLTDFAKKMQQGAKVRDEKLINTLSKIGQSAGAIDTIIHQFKQISVETAPSEFTLNNRRTTSFVDAIQHISNVILSEYNEAVALEVKGKRTLQFPMSDQHLHSILQPLIHNSFDHGFVQDEFNKILITLNEYSDHVEILYEDNGIGIEADQINNLFEPFFSTAKHKKHSGLGLFSVYNTVTAYCGTIDYQKNEKTGVTFVITLPFECSII